jgi:hypothetical protein
MTSTLMNKSQRRFEMLKKLAGLVAPRVGLAGLQVKRLAPELYLAAGVVAGVSSVIMVAKAHKRAESELLEITDEIEYIKGGFDIGVDDNAEQRPLTKQDKVQILAPYYTEIAKRSIRLYGPGVLMGVSSVALILASHGVLRGRNQALMATVGLLQQSIEEYRKRVRAEYGEAAEERLYYGAEERATTVLEVDENGKAKKRKKKQNHISEIPDPLMYSRIWDETNPNWKPDADISDFYLNSVQQQMNDKLYLRGYVMLNDVYRALGFAESPEGAVVGWSNVAGGDDFISFGLDADINQREGDSRRHLDFNVNGVVWELIGRKE